MLVEKSSSTGPATVPMKPAKCQSSEARIALVCQNRLKWMSSTSAIQARCTRSRLDGVAVLKTSARTIMMLPIPMQRMVTNIRATSRVFSCMFVASPFHQTR